MFLPDIHGVGVDNLTQRDYSRRNRIFVESTLNVGKSSTRNEVVFDVIALIPGTEDGQRYGGRGNSRVARLYAAICYVAVQSVRAAGIHPRTNVGVHP